MDDYPEVPHYSFNRKHFYGDSTGLALHLDENGIHRLPLMPEQEHVRFLCKLIAEAFGEFVLNRVHHNRWVTYAMSNVMASRPCRNCTA